MRSVLVTAFEPFGGETVNASWEAAKHLDGASFGDAIVAARMLPCAFELCLPEFVAAFERLKPSAVVMTGQAARRGMVSVERFALRSVSVTARDNRGELGLSPASGPDVVETTASATAVAHAIREAGVAARVSTDAGDYVCNHLYYGALRYLSSQSPTTAAIFIHLPATPAQSAPKASDRRLDSANAARALQAGVQALMRGTDGGRSISAV
ncbi:pyroglutamyl-peptidase I family protein [Roseiarcus sp.]|uniref:pyroglutamyl-peptidase I family protein n=1 Tax=Roseiarcus sp. TaxID=1969460 RepID=UPI003F987194